MLRGRRYARRRPHPGLLQIVNDVTALGKNAFRGLFSQYLRKGSQKIKDATYGTVFHQPGYHPRSCEGIGREVETPWVQGAGKGSLP